MKKLVVLILASLFVANVASAVVDPDTNSMGIYFDLTADNYEMEGGPGLIPLYVILTNPDFDALYGYEFGFEVVGTALVSQVVLSGTGPIDVGGGPGNHIVGLATPMATSEATLVATINLFALDATAQIVTLKGGTPNSVPGSMSPALLLANDVIIPTGLSAGFDEAGMPNPCLMLNDMGVVATDEVSIDAVKALYR